MGLADRRPILPAPTDSLIDSADEQPLEQDLATDLSRRTDATHHTLPDDGTPITLPTSVKRAAASKQSNPARQSQASLLIEYFESHSDPERRPSIRVRVAPSRSKNKKKGTSAEVEPIPVRQPSHRHRLPIRSLSSEGSEILPMATQRLSRPFEPDFQQTSEISVLSDSPPARYYMPGSDVSSMPADSLLGIQNPPPEISKAETSGKENLKPPVIPSGRNISNERLTQKVIEKLASKPRSSTLKPASERSRSSVSREVEPGQSRRRATKILEDDSVTGTASSLLTTSAISDLPKSHDGRSAKSGQSQVSINNPKLLQTVEDAIRRLILPELKEIKKDQKHATRKHRKEYPSDLSESSISREDVERRRSSGKSRRRSSGKDHSHRVSSGSRRHERSHKDVDYDSPSEKSYDQTETISSMSIESDPKARKHRKSHRARDVDAVAIAGAALTAAALKSHESTSSLDHREKRKKRSKSRSTRTESIAEEEEVFQKHNVPPMPFRSEVDSEITRSSLLSSNTNGTLTPTRREVREVVKGSPSSLQSPSSDTPSRTPVERSTPRKSPHTIQTGLGTHHGNFSNQDLARSREEVDEDDDDEDEQREFRNNYGPFSHGLLTDPERAQAYERNLHQQHPIRRGLSPIQSVASYATTEPTRNSVVHARSRETLSSPNKDQERRDSISEVSYSSMGSIDRIKAAHRSQGLSLENRSEVMQPHRTALTKSRDIDENVSPEAERRFSFANSEPLVPLQARSTYTDDSLDSPYIDKVTAGQQVGYGFAGVPQYVNGLDGPESAVASLIDASVVDSRAGYSPRGSSSGSPDRRSLGSPGMIATNANGARSGSPLKQQQSYTPENAEPSALQSIVPPVIFSQAVPRSTEKVAPTLETPAAHSNGSGDGQDATSPESEITTNPSVIQGPIAGYTTGDTSHWPYGPTPPPPEAHHVPGSGRDLGMTAPELVPEPLSVSYGPDQKRDVYASRHVEMTPPGGKDEGYETGANAPSPAIMPGQERAVPQGLPFAQEVAYEDDVVDNDPFTNGKRDQYISGLSHGMSPLYDNATGHATDRIYDKDIRALMDHMTVRDAQRNARDTEILITLVRTAAEMRNSFEDMKKLVADQGDVFLEENNKQHQQTQKAIGGPRPQPASVRTTRTPASMDEDLPNKRRNVFRRALMGLGSKNTQELQNIESMLMQLLDDVEGLRAVQSGQVHGDTRLNSINSADNARAPTDAGYEPEGQAGTSSTGDGIYSNNSSRQADYKGYNIRHGSGNRVSTVMERDEEYDDYDGYVDEQQQQQQTPTAQRPGFTRGGSEPVHTPPRLHDATQGTLSSENTPHMSNEASSGRKHKSFASSFLPKMVSRWSKTTASSGDYRASAAQQKPRPYSQESQSGSDLGGYDYDPHGGDAIRSNASLQKDQYRSQENRPPSPLIPSQVSDNSPKYQGFRNSMNLQHPQPRQGPTERYHNQLESEAQVYNNDAISPTSVTSSQWEAQAALTGMPGAELSSGYQHGGRLSPIASQRSTSSSSRQAPPRPPKELQDDPLLPSRPPKVVMSPPGSRQPTYVDHVTAARAGSPAYDKVCSATSSVNMMLTFAQSPVAALRSSPGQRKLSGPRPLTTSGQYSKGYSGDLSAVKRTRFRGSPNQIDSDENLSGVRQY